VTSCDLYPTILSVLGLPQQSEQTRDGVDITGLIEPSDQPIPPRDLYFHYPHYYPTTSPVSAIRSGNWKLLHYYEDDRVELYDLGNDLGETTNLAESEPETTRELRANLDQWLMSVLAQMPERNDRN
jgi:arylsulfatase A-like enzyme